MVIEYYKKGTVLERAWYALSKEDREELEKISERLQKIFLADSVGMHVENLSISGKSDVIVTISGCKQGMDIK